MTFRKFNYIGDPSRVRGVVTAKIDDGTVEVEMSFVNQCEENICPGDALPSRANGHVPLPPRGDWQTVRT